MEKLRVSKYTASFGLSLAICSIVNAFVVIAKESNKMVMERMKRMTGHHWITHSVFVILLFLILGWLLAKTGGNERQISINKFISLLVGGVLFGCVLIAGFYLITD